MLLFEPVPSEPAHLLVPALGIHVTYVLTYIHEILLPQNPLLVPDVDHGPRRLRRVLCMLAAESVDHPLPPQLDAGGRGRATGGWGRVTGAWGGNTNGLSDVTVGGWSHRRAG